MRKKIFFMIVLMSTIAFFGLLFNCSQEGGGSNGINPANEDTGITLSSTDYEYTKFNTHVTLMQYLGSSTTPTIPSTIDGLPVTAIGDETFFAVFYITGVTFALPSNITSIGGNAFKACSSLTNIIIPAGVTSINHHAFCLCTSLTDVTIPSSITLIDNYAFVNCNLLTSLTIQAPVPPALGTSVLYNTNSSLIIYVPIASVDEYKAASGWSNFASKITGY